uniref:CBM20 domain-containing protein n=1 Tax=Nelumbo nucifera TaxID=4432 RepID=A0A822YAV3_NELNU|nr:TPA_asm: hypothetical protein HUJ06_028156 [Nelumbo nucifera]
MMEALTSLSSRIFAKKCINSVSLRSRACFGRTQLQFLQPQKLSNVDSSLSFDLQRKLIGFLSCSLSSSDAQTDCDNTEDHIQATDLPGTVHVRFQLQQECLYGEKFLLVGDDPTIGLWDPSNAIPLTWSDGHVWTVDLDIPVGKALQFKFILKEITGEIVWQPGPDRALHTWETKNMITVLEDWENAEVQKITEELMADPNEGPLVNPNMEDMTVTNQNVMVDINQEMTVAENITHPNEELVANANPELFAAENFNHPKDEEMITVNEGEFIAENTTHPEVDLTANVKKEVTKEESSIHSNEEPKTHAKIELTAADNTLGSNGRTLSDKIPVFINNKENMITCKGPVLVPGLTPLPTVAMLNTEEVEETDVASACVEADEAKDCPAPEVTV